MAESFKNTLINKINNFGGNKDYWTNLEKEINQRGYNNKNSNRNNKKKEEVGSSNIRSVANICNNADCYSEIRLYIEYKIAKRQGWDEMVTKDKNFGEVVIDDMDFIYETVNKDDAEALKWISLYFGYLFWRKATIDKGKK